MRILSVFVVLCALSFGQVVAPCAPVGPSGAGSCARAASAPGGELEVQITYVFPMSAVDVDAETKAVMRRDVDMYSVLTKTDDGGYRYGVEKGMFGHAPPQREARFLAGLERPLKELAATPPPWLFAASRADALPALVQQRIRIAAEGVEVDTATLPPGVRTLALPPPGLEASRPAHIAAWSEHWFIPDKEVPDPEFHVVWRYRVRVAAPAPKDHEAVSFVLWAPRLNAGRGEPFGRVVQCVLLIDGRRLVWDAPAAAEPAAPVGQLIEMKLGAPATAGAPAR